MPAWPVERLVFSSTKREASTPSPDDAKIAIMMNGIKHRFNSLERRGPQDVFRREAGHYEFIQEPADMPGVIRKSISTCGGGCLLDGCFQGKDNKGASKVHKDKGKGNDRERQRNRNNKRRSVKERILLISRTIASGVEVPDTGLRSVGLQEFRQGDVHDDNWNASSRGESWEDSSRRSDEWWWSVGDCSYLGKTCYGGLSGQPDAVYRPHRSGETCVPLSG